ncbi:MAG: hypothetical protein BWY75_02997 [bacterium ADurb.Bin425]|nr:MAG: hypothetical protein BWY75_02997 [bacterium ADurb.Bin425]
MYIGYGKATSSLGTGLLESAIDRIRLHTLSDNINGYKHKRNNEHKRGSKLGRCLSALSFQISDLQAHALSQPHHD